MLGTVRQIGLEFEVIAFANEGVRPHDMTIGVVSYSNEAVSFVTKIHRVTLRGGVNSWTKKSFF